MDAGGPKGKAKSDINVTPLIDIVLVLLIIFIVMVPGLSKALPVVVPQVVTTSNPTPPDPRNPPVVLEITPKAEKEYKYSLQSQELELSALADTLSPVVQLQPLNTRKIFVKVDGDVPYQIVVNALDQVRLASEKAKKDTVAKPEMAGMDGGDIKVACSIKKKD